MDKINGKLVELIKDYLDAVDEEMAHGNYSVNPDYIPMDYVNEGDDYWSNHEKIVERATECREKLDEMLENINV